MTSPALTAWLEAGRLLEHLPGVHDQRSHGRRFRIPGDRSSGFLPTRAEREQARAAQELDELRQSIARAQRKAAASKRRSPARKGSVEQAVADADHLSATTGRPPRDAGSAGVAAARVGVLAAAERIYADQPNAGHRWIGMADLRDRLGDGHSREDVDQAIFDLIDQGVIRGTIAANTKALRKRDRDAAVHVSGTAGGVPETIDAIYVFSPEEIAEQRRQATQVVDAPPSVREQLAEINADRARRGLSPMDRSEVRDFFPGLGDGEVDDLVAGAAPAKGPTTARAKFAAGASSRMSNVLTPQDAVTRLRGMGDRRSGEQLLAKATRDDLVAIAAAGGVSHLKGANKTTLRNAVIEVLIGRRADSEAIARAVRGE